MVEYQRLTAIESELDGRMSAETKAFVRRTLTMMRPIEITRMDIETARSIREYMATAEVAAYSSSSLFEQVAVSDLSVPNSVDRSVSIAVKCFKLKQARLNSPVIVFFHGGGWTFGSSLIYYHACASLAQATKCVWLSVDYRLAPEYQLDAQLSDCRSVVDYVLRNKQQFSGTDAKIGVSGDSAGGHLAAIIAHELRDMINFQILIYPAVDLFTRYKSNEEFSRDAYLVTPEMLHFFAKNLLKDTSESGLRSPLVSPLFRDDFRKLPKCLILAAELDPLTGGCQAYHQKMLDNSSMSQLHVIKGVVHSFFHQGKAFPDAFEEALDVIYKFILRL